MPDLYTVGHFLHTSSIISGLFAENKQQLETSYASAPPCIHWRILFFEWNLNSSQANVSVSDSNASGVATISRLCQWVGPLCRGALHKQGSFSQEIYTACGVAAISGLPKRVRLFCKRASHKQGTQHTHLRGATMSGLSESLGLLCKRALFL